MGTSVETLGTGTEDGDAGHGAMIFDKWLCFLAGGMKYS